MEPNKTVSEPITLSEKREAEIRLTISQINTLSGGIFDVTFNDLALRDKRFGERDGELVLFSRREDGSFSVISLVSAISITPTPETQVAKLFEKKQSDLSKG